MTESAHRFHSVHLVSTYFMDFITLKISVNRMYFMCSFEFFWNKEVHYCGNIFRSFAPCCLPSSFCAVLSSLCMLDTLTYAADLNSLSFFKWIFHKIAEIPESLENSDVKTTHRLMVFIGKFTNIQLWIWNGFEWNSNEMSCILSTRLRFFQPRVFHRTISFHYSTMYTISRRMYPDSDSWYQWLLLVFLFKWIKCAQMLRTFVNNVCQHQKKESHFEMGSISTTNVKWTKFCVRLNEPD